MILHRAMTGMEPSAHCARRFKSAIPVGSIDIHRPDFDAVFLGVAYDLRHRIKSHWLAVQQGRSEHIRIAAFDPGRDINQDCKARRVAFWKAVFAEPLDLLKQGNAEGRAVTPFALAIENF